MSTQVGRALDRLGVEHIPAYSPEARGRSERMFWCEVQSEERNLYQQRWISGAPRCQWLCEGADFERGPRPKAKARLRFVD